VGQNLTNIGIQNAPDGSHSDARGLFIIKKGTAGRWIYRFQHLGRRRDMGLGQWPTISLAQARKTRDSWAQVLAGGKDPIDARRDAEAAEKAEREKHNPTLSEMIQTVFEARRDRLRGNGTRGRWLSPLTLHVIPKIGGRRFSEIHQRDIQATLKPIWRSKHPTAEKAIQRLRIVFTEARLMGFDCDPFTVDAAERMLGAVNHQTRHIPSTPWEEIPDLFQRLTPDKTSNLCLRWMILTLVRADGSRNAALNEIDGDVWTVPAIRVKGLEGKVTDFRVPLSGAALDMVDDARAANFDFLFPGPTGKPISDRSLEKRLDNMGEKGRPHGFRTSFRTWVQDTDACGFEVAETVLNHRIGTSTERSYARSDILERRRAVMDNWADFVTGGSSNIVKLLS
jgi:integrase